MRYTITPKMGELVTDLRNLGYTGSVSVVTSGANGTVRAFEEPFVAFEFTGFCKESLFIAYDERDKDYILVGRYNVWVHLDDLPDVERLTEMAWENYRSYKVSKGFDRPNEWEALFKTYGYLTTKTVEQVVERGD